MARRRSARSEPDLVDDDDDEFAWQPKKKKKKRKTGKTARSTGKSSKSSSKKKKRKSTGRTARSGSSDNNTSGKRKKKTSARSTGSKKSTGSSINRSGRRKKSRSSSGDSGDEMNSSARRRRSGRAMPKKKEGVSPVLLISIFTGALLICGIIIAYSVTRPEKIVDNQPAKLDEADAIAAEGMLDFKEWNKLKAAGDPRQDKVHSQAHSKLTKALEMYNTVLDQYRDADDQLPPEYEGYERPMQEIAIHLVDLEKGGRATGGH